VAVILRITAPMIVSSLENHVIVIRGQPVADIEFLVAWSSIYACVTPVCQKGTTNI
jgi:hypothetical protein